MSVPAVTPSTTQDFVEVKHCLGHETHVKKCSKREEVREESSKVLANYATKAAVLSSKTHMVEGTEKRKFLGSKKIYDLFITFFHKNDTSACNHFSIEKVAVIKQKTELDTTDTKSNDVYFDTVDQSIVDEKEGNFLDALDKFTADVPN